MDRGVIEGEHRVVGEKPAPERLDWAAGADLLGRTVGGLILLAVIVWIAPKLNDFFYSLFFG